MPTQLPDFVIFGALRSGTTSLARYLGAHPAIYMADRKEIHFFDREFERGLGWYGSHFPDDARDLVKGEGTPAYMSSPVAIRRMAEVIPNARLILSAREPIARLWSHYWLTREREFENRDFGDVIAAELELHESQGADAAELLYIKNSLYAHHLHRALEYFPKDKIHVVIFEELIAEPESEYMRLCRFLGVDDDWLPSNLGDTINPYVSFRSLALRKWTRRSPERVLQRVVARLNTRRRVGYPPMEDQHRATLEAFFRPHNAHLEEFLGRSILAWEGSGR